MRCTVKLVHDRHFVRIRRCYIGWIVSTGIWICRVINRFANQDPASAFACVRALTRIKSYFRATEAERSRARGCCCRCSQVGMTYLVLMQRNTYSRADRVWYVMNANNALITALHSDKFSSASRDHSRLDASSNGNINIEHVSINLTFIRVLLLFHINSYRFLQFDYL